MVHLAVLILLSCVLVKQIPLRPAMSVQWVPCACVLLEWELWSECTFLCYGTQYRSREITRDDMCKPYFEDCNGTEKEERSCNEKCSNGGTFSSDIQTPCHCSAGWYGRCCNSIVTCAQPGTIRNGVIHGIDYNYGDSVSYSCNDYYNMSGDNTQMCLESGEWSGLKPKCTFVNTCASNPCQNSGTCVDGLDEYNCRCREGYSGVHCENDIQAPIFTDCPKGVSVNATSKTTRLSWETPRASDPLGFDVMINSNYPDGWGVFPWGDFTVQYIATKAMNGLKTECAFNIFVRPTPCPQLNIPVNGAKVCNGWKTDMANLCLVFCREDNSLPFGQDHRQWWVCGAHGAWIPSGPLPDCSVQPLEENSRMTSYNIKEYRYDNCMSDSTRMKTSYIKKLNDSQFRTFCQEHKHDCHIDNVAVVCHN